MMRNFNPFCAVCSQSIRDTISPYLADCYAPVFAGSNLLVCLFLVIAYLLVLIILLVFAWIPGVRCTIKKLAYRITHCSSGNSDPCLEL